MSKKLKISCIVVAILIVIWATVIFLFSAENGDESSQSSGIFTQLFMRIFFVKYSEWKMLIVEFYMRKAAHTFIFAVLGGLNALFFLHFTNNRYIVFFYSTLLSLLYAVSDEIHQGFVPERSASALDVCIDTSGAILGIFITMILVSAYKEYKIKNRR